MDEQEMMEKLDEAAKWIINLSRDTLLIHLRFLEMALSVHRVIKVMGTKTTLMTDGISIAYNPPYICKCYMEEPERSTRDYLHMIMHCIYRHMYIDTLVDTDIWDIACDIAVENMMSELNLRSIRTSREVKQQRILSKLKKELNMITAEKVYRYYLDREPAISERELLEIREAFTADDHTVWYMSHEKRAAIFGYSDADGNGGEGSGSDSRFYSSSDDIEGLWKDISERMQVDLETFSKKYGDTVGSLTQNLKEINREKYDYSKFLSKFAVFCEDMKINEDEFDHTYYMLGLELYKDVLLVEPLEYKDVKLIKDFVIAIDSSASTIYDLAQAFVQKTYNILKEECFANRINLRIIQCDTEIQEDVKITSKEEFDEYIKTMKIKGGGGTDFVPVFERVNEHIENGEFTDLKGIIFFTDGQGPYPKTKPDYEAAFVFIDDDYSDIDVPSWAIKLILTREDTNGFK